MVNLKFSFIIASLGKGQHSLQNCIGSIEKAYEYKKGLEIEILVVFQNIKKDSCPIKLRYPELATFYYIAEKGLARARNYAIKRAKGELFIFLDDDAQIKEDFLGVLSEISSINTVGAFCGRIFEQNTNRAFSLCFINDKKRNLSRTAFRYFMGSSHILKKSVIDKVGLYDEEFGAGAKYPGAEESDIFFRLKKRGEKVAYIPELIFYHPVFNSIPASKVFGYSYAVGAMLTKQVFRDKRRLFTYIFIISEILFKTLLRSFQYLFFPKSIEYKNLKYHYSSALLGMLKGIYKYTRDRMLVFNGSFRQRL